MKQVEKSYGDNKPLIKKNYVIEILPRLAKKKFLKEYRVEEYARLHRQVWYEQHPMYNGNWRKKHPDYCRRYCKEWRKKHPDYMKSYSKKWRVEHPDYYRKYRKRNKRKLRKYWRDYERKIRAKAN